MGLDLKGIKTASIFTSMRASNCKYSRTPINPETVVSIILYK